MKTLIVPLLLAMLTTACGDGLGPGGPENVTLNFRSAGAPASGPATAPSASSHPAGAPVRSVAIEASNGTLVLDRVLMIVSEVELEHEDGCDDDDRSGGDDCEDFEADPYLVELPLDGTPVSVMSALIAPGVYDELEFEIEDLDDDDDDRRGVLEALWSEIRTEVPDWPRDASLYVRGTFHADGADPVAFRVFVDAEIEVELDLRPNLVIGPDGSASRDLIVDVRPDLWFVDAGGRVRDLTGWDWDATGRLLELEVELEDGFVEVEFDD